ncbi:GSCOCG00008178001-RA-CDS [Cotesia congregata]|uniref:Uncharacterized protein n=1 Tax=Cotesia congregata TaxID=51543 RepID=A0A8J2HQX9_COTCN|nr:GSCOCG00008178001-RA-CDS [Cotesia congregata]CAG5107833.1 Protein of unknown function [Cotesia congregata]
MGLNPLTWKLRSVVYILLMVLFYVLFIHKKVYHVAVEVTIPNTIPEYVWEFVADFSNMKTLNPTLEEFLIIDETGNLDHWKYTVRYKEHLSQIPSIHNSAIAHFSVKRDGDAYLIDSDHQTCFFEKNACFNTKSSFKFLKDGTSTRGIESIDYECPMIFSSFCHNEVMYQRNEIMNGLQSHFQKFHNIQTQEHY